jgi:WhiB family redox-sensing transcriptional regulator
MSRTTHQARGLAALARDANPARQGAVGIRAGFEDTDGAGENWRSRGECAKPGHDAEQWFPFSYTGGPSLAQIDRVRAICAGCPVRARCLAWAMETGQGDGIWAGTTPEQRKAIRRRLTRERLRAASRAEARAARAQNGPQSDVDDCDGPFLANNAGAPQRGAGDAHGPLPGDARDAHSATEGRTDPEPGNESPKTPSAVTKATQGRQEAAA